MLPIKTSSPSLGKNVRLQANYIGKVPSLNQDLSRRIDN
jgi:hypothetical protein